MTISAIAIAGWLRWRQGSKAGFWIFLGLSIMSFNTIFQGFIFGEDRPMPALVFSFFTLLALLTSASLAVSERHRELEMEHNANLLNRRLAVAEANQLRELDELKSRLYTNLTHEFRTPLTVILGLADQIKGYEKEKSLIRRNGKNLLRLINQMLEMSRIESGKASLEIQQSDILPFLHYVTDSFHSLALSKKISLSFFSPEERIVMDYDREKVRQILSNLIANAIKFTPEYGEVQVAVQKADQKLRLSVRDSGIGISREDLPGIFGRFRQADDSSIRKGEGTGIGLALVKELVKLMEGDIEVKSQLKKGSEFIVSLPIRNQGPLEEWKEETLETEPRDEATAADITPPVSARGSSPLLLIIEDNQDVVYYLQSLLQEEYRLLVAQNGAEGVELAIETVPDIIISDVMMPEKDGFEVCHELKQDEHTSHIPIILLTAKSDMASKKEGLQTGADAYLAKPFDREELFIRLQMLIEIRQKLKEKYQNVSLGSVPDTEIRNNPELQFLQKLEGVLQENLDNEDFRVYPHLCRAMLMSRPQLYRKIKALKDMSPSDYLRLYRLREARQLLLQTDEKVGDIAAKTGFRDPSYFTKAYTSEFGETPSETRNKK
ncbi:MAG: response regulator [Lewinellaceae bacterium]|nr:response regulator [Lewinellaceae bacterium]